jgi:predicted transcriptional regulator
MRLDREQDKLLTRNVQKAAKQVPEALQDDAKGLKVRGVHKVTGVRTDDVQAALRYLEKLGKIVSRYEKRPDEGGTIRWCKVYYVPGHAPDETEN